jgi:hypothetical protein
MNQNPNQRFQQQMQKQMQDQRQRQMQAAWYAQQQAEGRIPARPRSGCARIGTFVGTLVLSVIGFGILCGGIGFLAGGLLGDGDDTAVLGAIVGGIVAILLSVINASRATARA